MIRSTFSGFTTAQLAMRASQKALDITGQNISNINTGGYSRQRLDLTSFKPTGSGSNVVGSGVMVSGISQLRDPFLDIRFRNEIAEVGMNDEKLGTYKDLESIFDEVIKDGVLNQMSDLTTMLQKLSGEVGNKEFDRLVKTSAESLTRLFNQYSTKLNTIKVDREYSLENVDIKAVNDILTRIEGLNKSIKNSQVHGSPSLELIDQRNNLIDELSSYTKIDVKYEKELVGNVEIENLKITMLGSDGLPLKDAANNDILLVNGTKQPAAQFGVDKVGDDIVGLTINGESFTSSQLGNGSFKGSLEMLQGEGDFGANGEIRGIPYYEKMIDLMANTFADALNNLNGPGKPLFESTDGGPITSANIKISDGWANEDWGITTSNDPNAGSGQNDNILKMIETLNGKLEYKFQTGVDAGGDPVYKTIFNGSFHEYFTNIGSTLGLDIKTTNSLLENHSSVSMDIASLKDSISSVSLDEEGMNLLHYQKSYNAAARLMTTLDEALDTIINKMGVVGR